MVGAALLLLDDDVDDDGDVGDVNVGDVNVGIAGALGIATG